jgi:hypothetical protein
MECGTALEPYVATLEQETALLRARRAHLSENAMETLDQMERIAHQKAVLQARLARALKIVQAMAERRMPRYRRELDTLGLRLV